MKVTWVFVCFCVHDTVATRGQYLALSKVGRIALPSVSLPVDTGSQWWGPRGLFSTSRTPQAHTKIVALALALRPLPQQS